MKTANQVNPSGVVPEQGSHIAASKHPLTKAMLRELRCIQHAGQPSDPYDWSGKVPDSLWFSCREKVLDALFVRQLIRYGTPSEADFVVTDAGQAALARAI